MDNHLPAEISEEKEDDYYFYLDPKTKELQKICIKTGKVVQRSARFTDSLVHGTPMAPEFVSGNTKTWVYNKAYGDLICQFIAEGKTLTEISKTPGMPSNGIIARWRAEHPELEELIKVGRKMRAERYADRLADTLEDTRNLDKDDVPAEKLYTDKLKWLAEKNDPDTYGNRTKVTGDKDQPLTLKVLDTGIRREPIKLNEKGERDEQS